MRFAILLSPLLVAACVDSAFVPAPAPAPVPPAPTTAPPPPAPEPAAPQGPQPGPIDRGPSGFSNPLAGLGDGASRPPSGGISDSARVSDVAVRPDRVVIRLSDGARCVANRPEGVQGGWSGTTSNCGYTLPYTVSFTSGGSSSRFSIERNPGAPIEGSEVGARSEVYVTDVDGNRRLFVRPLPSSNFETLSN